MNSILRCCENTPLFLVVYNIGSKFYVCNSCLKSGCWSRGIKEKTPITELETGFERPSSSEMDVINTG